MSGKRLFIIDGAGFYFRAFYGIRQFLQNSKGTPTNAVYGFARMLKNIIDDHNPDLLLMALDSKEKTFRHKIYPDYKANRSQMPEELAEQLPLINRLISAMGITVSKISGYEADDIIGTVAKKGAEKGFDVTIVSSDKDLMQLVGQNVIMFDAMKNKIIDETAVLEKFGVPPEKVTDILGLMGDSSDNIPGVPGVGEKTAITLVKEYGSLEAAISAAPLMTKKRLKENLIENKKLAILSKELATIDTEVPVDFAPEKWRVEPQPDQLKKLYDELEFFSLAKEIENVTPLEKVERKYICVTDIEELNSMITELSDADMIAIDTETDSIHPTQAKLVGISFSSAKGKAWYLPLAHEPGEGEKTIDFHTAIETVRPLLESARPKKCGHNIKYDLIVLENAGLKIGGVAFDTMIASYLINPSSKHALSAQVFARLGEKMIEYEEVCGKGVKAITFDKVPIEQAAIYSAEDADMTLRLYHLFVEEIKKEPQIKKLYYEIEIPTMQVLKVMEQNGVLIDVPALEKLSEELSGSIEKLEEKIYHLAGEKFNPASPKQVGVILFDKLGLPGGKKTKTGFSTSVDVLEQLSSLHELPADLLEFRSLSKLKNTYVDVLPKMIDKGSGRIHTSYNQAVAATGRLSSSDPNLQNIPIRTQTGRRIRQAFIAPAGYVLLAADYSQIELRLLAHFAKEEKLIEAFAEDRDIHKETASMLFDVVPELVTSDMRRIAKTVNFGVIYGQTPFGLARELNIPQNEAKRYIDNYFARYPGILDFNKQIIEQGKKDGYVQTLFGRRRYLPDLTSKNRQVRMFAERNAMNSPLQGTSADIIKIAMIKIQNRIEEDRYGAKIILQVHDELVFECAENEAGSLAEMVREEMRYSADLLVELKVETGVGKNWDLAH